MIPELRTFLAIARHGTFTAAGEAIGLSQTAVSGHIRRLEQHFGLALFDRSRRAAILNDDGLRLQAQAQAVVDMFDTLATSSAPETAQTLQIGAISSVQSRLLVTALQAFRQSYPGVRVKVRPGQSLHLVDALDAGELDLALVIRPSVALPVTLRWTDLLHDPYVLALPPGTQGSDWREQIKRLPFLRYDRSSYGGRTVAQFLESEALVPQDIVEIDDLPALWAMVERGLGAAILPLGSGFGATPISMNEAIDPTGSIERQAPTWTVTGPLGDQIPIAGLGPQGPMRSIGILHSDWISPVVAHFKTCILGAATAGMRDNP